MNKKKAQRRFVFACLALPGYSCDSLYGDSYLQRIPLLSVWENGNRRRCPVCRIEQL